LARDNVWRLPDYPNIVTYNLAHHLDPAIDGHVSRGRLLFTDCS
jgi:hypothetical protein